MPRLGRRSAAEQVSARAARLSDDLLMAEEQCFAEIEMAFAAGAATADTVVRSRWAKAKQDPKALSSDAGFRQSLTLLHSQTIADSRASVAALASQAVALALEAIEDELVICEHTLGKRYGGIAVEGVESARSGSEQLVTQAMALHEKNEGYGQAAFTALLSQQTLFAAQRQEGLDRVLARLLSPTAVNAVGIGGRGAWWRTTSGLEASARYVSIGLSNAVRQAAMVGMNRAGEARQNS